MTNTTTIKIFDTTLRDGEQAPGFSMNKDQKVKLALQLEKLGVDVIEAGFPAASVGDFEGVQAVCEVITKAEVSGFCRAMQSDISRTWEAIANAKKPRIYIFLATSPLHMEHKLKKTPEQVLEMAKKAVSYAKSLCSRVTFCAEDAVRSDKDFLKKVFETVIDAGADTIVVPDTVGYFTPIEYGDLIEYLVNNIANLGNTIVAVHCHNDLGLAVANSLQGIVKGATEIQCTINGIGERAGNASLEECVMALKVRSDYFDKFQTNIITEELYPTSKLLTAITGVNVQPNKAIVGSNAFAHEAGIHQDGMLKNRKTYEIMTPESVGLNKNKIILGKHSGKNALFVRFEDLGINIQEDQKEEVFIKFKELADKKRQVFDEDLFVIIGGGDGKEMYKLVAFSGSCGTMCEPFATVVLEQEKNTLTAFAKGNGVVDACYNCINQIVNLQITLLEYNVTSVTQGIDAQVTVSVRTQLEDGRIFGGSSTDTDIVKASTCAYIQSINRSVKFTDNKLPSPRDSES